MNTKARIIKWDERNFVVQTWNEVTNPKTKEKRWEWMDQGFFATIETAAYFSTRKGYDTDTVITPDIIREVTRTIINETKQVMQEHKVRNMKYEAFWRSHHKETVAQAEAAGLNVEDLYADATARDEEEGE